LGILYLHFDGHFPGEHGLAGFIGAEDDGSGDENWSCKTCKAPIKSSPSTNQHPTVYRPDALPVAQPTLSKHTDEQYKYLYIACKPRMVLSTVHTSIKAKQSPLIQSTPYPK